MLTKSKFRRYLDCRNEFWLDHHEPEPAGEETLEYQFRRESGYEVEALARTLSRFVGEQREYVEFGKDFIFEELFAKADIVVTDPLTDEIEIYEVKSSASVKPEHQIDLAFQCLVANHAGFKIKAAYLVTVDTGYVFEGDIDADRLLRITEETDRVNEILPEIGEQIEQAKAWVEGTEPVVELVDYCKPNKLKCPAITRRFPDIPEYNVGNLFNAGTKKLHSLLADGVLDLRDIPEGFALTEREQMIVDVARSGEPHIDREKILTELNDLEYPLNFLDYESFGIAVPKFASTRPYQQMVFQYSLHSIESDGSEARHSGHLSRNDGEHPVKEIVERLVGELDGQEGTVLIWSEGFEKKRNEEMGEMFPQHREFFNRLNESVYDLRKIFSRRLYLHPAFHGRDSIKKVLPILCPEMTYEGMGIADGLTASIKWYHASIGRGTPEEREQTFSELEDYCHQDTLAMVRIFEHLREL